MTRCSTSRVTLLEIASRLARMENAAFVNGNGVKKPRGFLTYPGGMPTASNFGVIEQVPTGGAGAFAASNPGDALINLALRAKGPLPRPRGVHDAPQRIGRGAQAGADEQQQTHLWQPGFPKQARRDFAGLQHRRGGGYARDRRRQLVDRLWRFRRGWLSIGPPGILDCATASPPNPTSSSIRRSGLAAMS